MEKTKRLAYWDNWKGLSIIAVVAIHASNTAFNFPVTSLNFMFGLGLRQIITYAVPMFLSIAGYFAANAINESTIQYYQKRIWRIIVPYAVWTSIYLIITTPSTIPGWSEIIKGYLIGSGIGIGYFVIVLIQFVVITPLLLSINNIKVHLLIIASLTFAGLVFTYYFSTQNVSSFFSTFPGKGILFFVWYPFYHGGLFISRYKEVLEIERIKPSVIQVLIFFALIFAFFEGIFWANNDNFRLGASQLKLSSFFLSFLIFLLAVILVKKESWLKKDNFLTWLGINSFPIYLTHLLFLRVVQKLSIFKQIYDVQPLYILFVAMVSLAASSLFIYVGKKVTSPRASQIIFG